MAVDEPPDLGPCGPRLIWPAAEDRAVDVLAVTGWQRLSRDDLVGAGAVLPPLRAQEQRPGGLTVVPMELLNERSAMSERKLLIAAGITMRGRSGRSPFSGAGAPGQSSDPGRASANR